MLPIEMKTDKFNELTNICTELKTMFLEVEETPIELNNRIKTILNEIFETALCTEVLFTNNIDKVTFGVFVNPTLSDNDLMQIIIGDEEVNITRYAVEIDLQILLDINGLELAAYIIENVSSVLNNSAIDTVRFLFDDILVNDGEYINVKESINYSQILIFGIKDTIRKVSDLLFKDPDSIGNNEYASTFEISDILKDITGILRKSIFGQEDITSMPKLGIIQWVLMIYKDISTNYKMAEDTLLQASTLTGSVLEKREIDKTLRSIRRALSEVVNESAVIKEKVVQEVSLFKKLKRKGLQAIQDDLYEFKIRLKNCEDIEESMYILRQINSRIAILEDYLDDNECTMAEEARWRAVIDEYIALRSALSNKKIGGKKQYQVWYDTNYIDSIKDDGLY